MPNIGGTLGNDTITPNFISAGVWGGRPSDGIDVIRANAGADVVDGGGGNDTPWGRRGPKQ